MTDIAAPKYIIQWQSKITGFEGQGEPLDEITALTLVNEANKEYPNIEHKIQKVESK